DGVPGGGGGTDDDRYDPDSHRARPNRGRASSYAGDVTVGQRDPPPGANVEPIASAPRHARDCHVRPRSKDDFPRVSGVLGRWVPRLRDPLRIFPDERLLLIKIYQASDPPLMACLNDT
ncbi:hypothetical protein GW17_00058636, partial [Ensete ventricosum]